MNRLLLLFVIPLVAMSCASTQSDQSMTIELSLAGDMLFEGSNTLQTPSNMSLAEVAAHVSAAEENVKSVGIGSATLSMQAEHAELTESLLLQIVSDNHALTTVGTLSPLTDAGSLKLNLSENIDLLPYLKDSGSTWVLDMNLRQDFENEIAVSATIALSIDYTE